VIELRLWLPESLASAGDEVGARVLDAQLADFDARQAAVTLSASPKKDRGPGGLLDLLRAARPVAPAALPDLILLSDADLAVAAREGLILPLDDLLDAASEAGLFAFARSAARIDGKRMGLPLAADFDHLVFARDRLDAPPADWEDLIAEAIPIAFALAGDGHVSDAVLAVYARLNGTLINAEGQPTLTFDALARLLELYRNARAADVIAAPGLDWPDAGDVWDAFRASGQALAIVRASRYLSARGEELDLGFARLPSIDGQPVAPIGRVWSLVLVTRDPGRQALAVELMAHLSRSENAAAWTRAAHILPARAEALALWETADEYVAFARGELNRAAPPPSPAALDAVSPAFLNAIRDVLSGRSTPQAAATSAVDAVARGGK
jgi:ABC-type glycerol-3-phosphate transport system substrate-binding protein